ncbi:MAG: DMT family transporter [Candidatus Thiodiazotropha endolucinida]
MKKETQTVPVSCMRGAQLPIPLAHTYLVLTAFFLASNHVIGRGVHDVIPPVGLNFWRWTAGALILLPWVLKGGSPVRVFRGNITTYILLGGFVTLSTMLILIALRTTTAVNVSVISVFQPILTVIIAATFLGERLRTVQLAGIFAACTGVAVMLFHGSWSAVLELEINSGDLLTLLAVCGFSAYAINVSRIPLELSSLESLFGIIVTGCIILLPFYLVETIWFMIMPMDLATVGVVLVLALTVSVFGMLMWNQGNQAVGPSRAAVFLNLIPVFAAILAAGFLGEHVYWFHWLGAGFIGLGIWLVVKRVGNGDGK